MRISQNYYNYYYQNSQLSTASNAGSNSAASDFFSSDSSTISDAQRKQPCGYGSAANLSLSGSMMKYSLQTQDTGSSDFSEKMEKLKTDTDSIKSEDIDSMTADEVKETLATLQSDFEALQGANGGTSAGSEADLDNMSEADMRKMLKNIQENANNMPPPPPPMMGGFDPVQMLGNASGSGSSSSTDSSIDAQNTLQQIIDKLTESYDSTTESSDDYVEKLKESLAAMFEQQKNNIDSLSDTLFTKLDDWSSQAQAV